MRRVMGLMLLAAAGAAAATTTVSGTIRDVAGTGLSGTCTVRALQTFAAASGERIAKNLAPVTVTDGAFSVDLAPGATAVGGPVDYSMTCRLTNARNVAETYTYILRVPASAEAVDLNDVILSTPAGSTYTVLLTQIGQGGANANQCLVWSGTAWGPGSCAEAGGMAYPAAGIPNSTGSAWGASYAIGTAAGTVAAGNHAHAAAYAGLSHAHAISEVTGLQTGLDGKVNTSLLSCSNDGYALKYRVATGWACEADQTGSAGGGVSSLNGLAESTQTFAKGDDANVTLGIVSAGTAHTFTLGWTGALAKARQHAATLYSDGAYTDPAWLTLTAAGGRISGFALTGHNHSGAYEPVDATLLRSAAIGVSVAAQSHDHNAAYLGLHGKADTAGAADTAASATSATTASALAGQYIDWSASSGPTSIANKPSLGAGDVTAGTLATSRAVPVVSASKTITESGVTIDASNMVTAPGGFTTGAGALEISGPEQAAPTASEPTCYIDSTTHLFTCKNGSDAVVGSIRALGTTAGTAAEGNHTHTQTRLCELHIWGTGTASALQDTDDEAASCFNGFGVTETITAVRCWANAGSPTVTPIVTGGAADSILSGALTCGTASFASGTLNGTPTLASAGSIAANITTAGGTATNIRLVFTLTR